MHVIQVVASIAAAYGGPSRSVPALCSALALAGDDVRLVTTEAEEWAGASGVRVVSANGAHNARAIGVASPFARTLRREIEACRPDVIHDHGAWLRSNRAAASAARRAGIPFLVSTRGMFSPWALANGRAKKRVAWLGYQRRILREAQVLHATSEAEAVDLRDLGIRTPVAVVPNGTELPSIDLHSPRPSHAIYLGRLHPVKGLPLLLDAWRTARPAGWTLDLVGAGDPAYVDSLRLALARLNLEDEVVLRGPADDDEKWRHYAAADLFILPSHSENFGLTVAEALASGVPVITTRGTPWRRLQTENCGWWVGANVAELAGALHEATALSPQTRREMGLRGRRLIAREYSWPQVGRELHAVYEWAVHGGATPATLMSG